jgi:phosphohistidine phosphatase
MKLYVMRHGPAEDFSSTGRDFDRALTPAGKARVSSVVEALVSAGEAPRVVVSSPLVRAKETASLVAPFASDSKTVVIEEAFTPGGDAAAYVRARNKQGARRLMVVGHEPDLSELIGELLGASFRRDMLKAMVVGLRLGPEGPAELRFVLDPKALSLTRA